MTEPMNLDAAAYTALGTPRDRVALPGSTFDGTVNVPVMHQAVKAFLANQRQGTHATKTRRWVVGGNQKPWKQKGTGRARQGSTRAPHFVGGGTVFGPQPHGYRENMPKQVRQLARKSALNARAREGALVIIDRFAYDKPKTAQIVNLVSRVEAEGKKVLILTDGAKPSVYLSARNIPGVEVRPYADVTAYDVVWSDVVLVEATALGHELAPVAEKAMDKVKKAAPAKAPKAAKAEKAPAKKPAAKKAAPKVAAKKAPAEKAAPKAAAKKAPAKKAAAPKKKGK
ncbi:MAG: 50S ribosomal protein L4 [Gemmatimonadetes bacterium]|jgi:large subunit ribosomal protein L4|nr:50S ribosomal protein L4 [Gemmatimonadota bacterium]